MPQTVEQEQEIRAAMLDMGESRGTFGTGI